MSVVIVIEEKSLSVSNLRWPLRIAKLRDAAITVLVCAPKNIGESIGNVPIFLGFLKIGTVPMEWGQSRFCISYFN